MNRRNFIASIGAGVTLASTNLAANIEMKTDPFQQIKDLLAKKEPLKWLFTGDSITHGALHTYGWRSYVEHFAERVRFEMGRMNDVVINTGISGDVLHRLMDNSDWRIFQFRPDIISMKIGMNDCKEAEKGLDVFRRSFDDLAEKASKQNAVLMLNTPNLIDFEKAKQRQALPIYVNAIREIAEAKKLPLVDHYAHWEKETANSSRLQMWLNDGSIHPNNYGHIVLARKIFQDIGIFDPKSITCSRLFVP